MSEINIPYNPEAEAALLGNLLQYKNAMQDCFDVNIQKDDFYLEKNKIIYSIIYNLYESNTAIDPVVVAERLENLNLLEKAGGREYLLQLVELTVASSYTVEYAKIVKSRSLARQLISAGEEIKTEGQNSNFSIDKVLTDAQEKINKIIIARGGEDIKSGKVVFEESLNKIKDLKAKGAKITGVKSNFEKLDNITTGFQNGDFIILAARPSVGKTALGLNFALNAATYSPGAVAFFSMEMSAVQVGLRMISIKSGVNLQKLRTGNVTEDELSHILRAISILQNQNIYVDDSSVLNTNQIYAKCNKLKQTSGLSIVFIDYIGLIEKLESEENRQQEVAKISRSLKAMARDLNVPVVALSQLRRSPQQQKDKRPFLSDLRESGALEQDADLVLLIHRPNYYDNVGDKNNDNTNNAIPKIDKNGKQTEEEIELIVAKHRNGPSGMDIKLRFDPNTTAYYSVDTEGE